MLKQRIAKLVEKSIKELQEDKKLPEFKVSKILIDCPKEKFHGDYSTNIVLKMGPKNPIKTANFISQALSSPIFEKIEVVKPGFINFFISENYLQKQVKEILKQGDKFGSLKIGRNQKVNVEFISANPTGPLTLGNGRGGFCGDVLSNVLEKAGYKVEREYYVNDIGGQIKKLGQWQYKGKYINDLKKKVKEKNPEKAGEKAGQIILKEMIKPSTKKMGIKFDTWFSEKGLYKRKEVDKVLDYLKKKKLTYQKQGALWFKSTKFGDDKDRVLVKKDSQMTYFASDLAYLRNKFKRGFDKLIFFWGADHYGYINRIKAGAQAFGYKKEQVDIIIMQLVQLFKEGKQVKMSKRTGTYVSLDELIDEVGLDSVRFFFLMRTANSHLNFNLDLAKEQSEKNPVYYIQYAHARISSILRKEKNFKFSNFDLLNQAQELNLIKQLIRFPEIVEEAAKDYQVQKIPQYALDIADAFHQFYESCRVISQDKKLSQARLSLISATKIVLKKSLVLMGINAPEKM